MSMMDWNKALVEIPFYKKRPYMKPWVGKNYDSPKHHRLLLVGESFYLPDSFDTRANINAWYDGTFAIDGCEDWCTTGLTITNDVRANTEWRKAVQEALGDGTFDKDVVEEFAFYNYWLRPAQYDTKKESPQTFEPQEKDRGIAIATFLDVVCALRPEYIAFCSADAVSKAEGMDYKRFAGKTEKELWDFTEKHGVLAYRKFYHPTWWYKPVDNVPYFRGMAKNDLGLTDGCGNLRSARDFFIAYLKQKWLAP